MDNSFVWGTLVRVKPEVTADAGLELERVDLDRQTAWLNQTKDGMPRGLPLNRDAINVLKAKIRHFRFHDLRHTWASWHRQAGTSCDELKDLGGWKSRQIVDRYAKFAKKHLSAAAARIESHPEGSSGSMVGMWFSSPHFPRTGK